MDKQAYIRCMGGWFCDHAPGTCTASPEYQAAFATVQQGEPRGSVDSGEPSAEPIYIWFADNGNIRRWSRDAFPEGDPYYPVTDAELLEAAVEGQTYWQTRCEALAEALRKCRYQFRFYTAQHLAKSPPDAAKAATNHEFEMMCLEALSTIAEKGARDAQ